jgi:hypothetical protein
MSANTYWRPAAKGRNLPCLSSFLDLIGEAKDYGRVDGELTLHGDDIPILRGIAAADKSTSETVAMLIEAILTHGSVHVWREY